MILILQLTKIKFMKDTLLSIKHKYINILF
jgi:hypothetical protein